MKRKTEKIFKFIRYSIVGGFCTIINLVLFFIFVQVGMHYIVANIISYLLAVALNYLLSKYFVFTKNFNLQKKKEEAKIFGKFLGIRLLNMMLDNILFYIVVSIWGSNVYAARVVLTVGGLVLSYCFINRFVFLGKEEVHKNL